MKGRSILFTAALLASHCVAVAAPVQYSFTTSSSIFGSGPVSSFQPGSFVSGSFTYDAAALAVVPEPSTDGSTSYRGFTPQSVTGLVSSITSLSGSVSGLSFFDVSGSTVLGNHIIPAFSSVTTPVDFLTLVADPSAGSPSPSNLTGFSIDGFTLVNVRLFWLEGQAVPEVIPDFLNDNSLPGTLPSIHGMLSLDFAASSNLSGPRMNVSFHGLSVSPVTPVPEPETYAMLLAGLALLGCEARRRKKIQHDAA
jgi:hypothetical protein